MADCCGHGNEPAGFIKGVEFIDYLGDNQLLKDSGITQHLSCREKSAAQNKQRIDVYTISGTGDVPTVLFTIKALFIVTVQQQEQQQQQQQQQHQQQQLLE
jgi:hypothetical protein